VSRAPNSALAGLAVLALIALAACSGTPSPSQNPPSASAPASESAQPTSAASTSAASTSAAALDAYYSQELAWHPCDDGFDCATVRVPLDYADPAGPAIDLAVVRLKAKAPRGSLLLNPGGPGASGIEQARAAQYALSPAVIAAYDVVGFDPRGVAGSNPVDCVTDAQLDAILAADWTPDTSDEEAVIAGASSSLSAGCARDRSGIAAHMGTANSARDMDILRAVLGDERLNYLGWSYGSYLGQAYAALFPNRVGRLVLDGILPL
jgi:pimeloyl-ACP methyl ester carboxylesterase